MSHAVGNHKFSQYSDPNYSKESCGGIWRVMPLNVNQIVAGSYDHNGRLWNLEEGESGWKFTDLKTLEGAKREVLSIVKATDQIFLTGSSDGKISYWSHEGGLVDQLIDRKPFGFYSMALLEDGQLATGACQKPRRERKNWSHCIRIWDIWEKRFLSILKGHDGGISGIVSLENRRLASCSGDKTVRIWDLERKKAVKIFTDHTDYLYSIAKLNDHTLLSTGKDRKILQIDLQSEIVVASFEDKEGIAHASTIYEVNTFEETMAVSASRDGYVKLWDSRTQKAVSNLDAEDGFVYSANFMPDGKVIAGTSGKAEKTKKKEKQNNAHAILWDLRK